MTIEKQNKMDTTANDNIQQTEKFRQQNRFRIIKYSSFQLDLLYY